MRTKSINIYTFKELLEHGTERAKEKARRTLREWATGDSYWHDYLTGDIWPNALKQIGFYDPKIYFCGFWSQGDGACFIADGCDVEKLIEFMSTERTPSECIGSGEDGKEDFLPWVLHKTGFVPDPKYRRLLMVLEHISSSKIQHRGHYYHEQSASWDLDLDYRSHQDGVDKQGRPIYTPSQPRLVALFREFREDSESLRVDLCHAIYKSLEDEYEHCTSDESIAENAEANGYEFDEDGNIA